MHYEETPREFLKRFTIISEYHDVSWQGQHYKVNAQALEHWPDARFLLTPDDTLLFCCHSHALLGALTKLKLPVDARNHVDNLEALETTATAAGFQLWNIDEALILLTTTPEHPMAARLFDQLRHFYFLEPRFITAGDASK